MFDDAGRGTHAIHACHHHWEGTKDHKIVICQNIVKILKTVLQTFRGEQLDETKH